MRRDDEKPDPQPAGAKSPPRPPRRTARGLGEGGGDDVYRVMLIKRVILGTLAQAQRDNATDVAMGPATDGRTAIRYKIDGTWINWLSGGGIGWSQMLPELAGLAGIRNTKYPKKGILYVAFSGVRLRWHLEMTNHDNECLLHNVGAGNV